MSKIQALRILVLAKHVVLDTPEYKEFAATHSARETKAFMYDAIYYLMLDLKRNRLR